LSSFASSVVALFVLHVPTFDTNLPMMLAKNWLVASAPIE
jgi:hypothetical protein